MSTSRETPCISCFLWNPHVHDHVHNSQPLIPIQSQINPIHIHHMSCLTSIFMSPLICSCVLQSPLSSWFSIKIMYTRTYIFPPLVPHSPPILSTSISSPKNYLVSINHEASHYATPSIVPLFPPSPTLPQCSILKCPQPPLHSMSQSKRTY